MKLKPIVASMLAMTVSAGVAVASSQLSTLKTGKTDAMKAKIAKMEAVLDNNQGQAYSFADLPMAGWQNRVTVSGLVGVDGTWSTRTRAGTAATSNRFANNDDLGSLDLNVANIYVDAEVNCYTTVHLGLAYNNTNDLRAADHPRWNANNFYLDEGYVTISNFAKSPLYLRVGKQNVDFGNYYRFPITASLTQLLSETQANAGATLGFVDASGIYASAYTFKGANTQNVPAGRQRINNAGARVGYQGSFNNVGFNANVDYIYSMDDVFFANAGSLANNGGANRVGGLAAHLNATFGQFDGAVDWVMALKDSNRYNFNSAQAAPKAVSAELGYSFDMMGLPSRVAAGYQHSWEALGSTAMVQLPQQRVTAQYGVELGRNTDLTLQGIYDHDYDTTDTANNGGLFVRTGTNRASFTLVARLGVRFA